MDRPTPHEQLMLMSLEELRTMASEKLNGYEPTGPQDLTISILRALSELAPSEVVQRNITVDILSCATYDDLFQLAERYRIGLLLPMRAVGERTTSLEDYYSQPPANYDKAASSWTLKPTNCDQPTMRELVLQRDNYRCIVSGKCNFDSIETNQTTMQQDEHYTVVDTAYILPFALVPRSDHPLALQRSEMVRQTITAFSGISPEELSGDKINCTENSLSLESAMHRVFRNLSLCFEATSEVNTYQVRRLGRLRKLKIRLPDTISFVPRSGIPVPDPRYLALHAACAKVVHQAGLGEGFDRISEGLEETLVLSGDGSSAYLLQHAIEMIMPE